METIVIGHKNPDMDSICSAIAYAELKRATGMPNVIAARAGNTNERIDFVLKKFGFDAPVFISDLSPRVADVMQAGVVAVGARSPIYDAIHLLEEKQLRVLPVVDEQRRCLGLLSTFKISHYLFPPREETGKFREVHASLSAMVSVIGGSVLTGDPDEQPRDFLLVIAAMDAETFARRLGNYRRESVIVVVGDRTDIQLRAVAEQVCAIIVTGGLSISEHVKGAAADAGVAIISSPHDSATTAFLAHGAARAEEMLDRSFRSFSPETLLREARASVSDSDAFVFPVLDDSSRLVGIFSKSDFLKAIQRQLILVDHNELSQAVTGADSVPIIEVLDHHRLAGFSTDMPILFWNNPVGSTATIVAMCYEQAGVPIPPPIAGLLMAGLISDTLNLSSPTATATDRRVLHELEKITGESATHLSMQIFSIGSPLLTLTPEQVITADSKEYVENGLRFTVSQIEELTFTHFYEREAALAFALEKHCIAGGYYFAALLVTDVTTQDSLLLVAGAPEFAAAIDFPTRGTRLWELAGVVSRKKQLLPYLLTTLDKVQP